MACKQCFYSLFAVFLYILPTSAAIAKSSLEVMYHERPPYYVSKKTGGIGGIIGDIATSILTKAHIRFHFRQVPASRQLNEIKLNRKQNCALGWFKTAQRQTFAKYSDPIYRDKPVVMLVRKSDPKTAAISSLRDLTGKPQLRMGAKLGYSYGPVIDELASVLKTNVVTAPQDNAGMVRMLAGKRFDYFFAAAEEAPEIINKSTHNIAVIALSDAPPGNKRYIICSFRVGDQLMHKINAAIE
jgi:uncharacterized protein (TIGR02285 family)